MLIAMSHSSYTLTLKLPLPLSILQIHNKKKKTFVVSHVMIVAFNPKLDLDRIIIQRSFAHSIEQLTTLDNFTREQLFLLIQV